MRARTLSTTTTAMDEVPFLPNYGAVVINPTASAANLTSSDAVSSGFTTLVAVPALSAVEVVIDKPFLRASAGTLILLGN